MKHVALFAIVLGLFGSRAFGEIKTVDKVDLAKFAGTWYRISANQIIFEPKCACARQVLTPTADGKVAAHNSCNEEFVSGKLTEVRGTAMPVDASGSKLAVDFGFPWKGDYWIIALDASYRYAVVTDRFGYSLYVMSRAPTLESELYDEAVLEASSQVNTKNLVMQTQRDCRYPLND